jgi:glycosyltransferase involved in cell wall biosynthesis
MYIPPSVDVPPTGPASRERFDLDDADFVFLSMFDHRSATDRKNPLGAIAAFQAALTGTERVKLLIKSINGDSNPESRAEMDRRAQDDQRLRIFDGSVRVR